MSVRQFAQNLLRLHKAKLPVKPFNCLIKLQNTLLFCNNNVGIKKHEFSQTYIIISWTTAGFVSGPFLHPETQMSITSVLRFSSCRQEMTNNRSVGKGEDVEKGYIS
jgi:hypothetical protein